MAARDLRISHLAMAQYTSSFRSKHAGSMAISGLIDDPSTAQVSIYVKPFGGTVAV
jgi:hypothetical protein